MIYIWVEAQIDIKSRRDQNSYLKSFAVFRALAESTEMATRGEIFEANHSYTPRHINRISLEEYEREIIELEKNYTILLDRVDKNTILDETSPVSVSIYSEESIDREELDDFLAMEVERKLPHIYAEKLYTIMLADRILPLLTIYQTLIEDYTVECIDQGLMSNHYRGNAKTWEFLEDKLPQPGKEELLKRTGTLSHDIVDKMENIRITRNRIVHNLRNIEYFELIRENVGVVEDCSCVIESLNDYVSTA